MQYKIACFTDTHLDYKQYGLESRQKDFLDAFIDAMRICSEQRVDYVIIPGDLMDNKFVSLKTLAKVNEIFESTVSKNLSTILGITGNHDDPTYSWMDFFYEINPELDAVALNGYYDAKIFDLKVYGFNFKREGYEEYLESELKKITIATNQDWWDFFNVLVIHDSPKSQGGGISDEFFDTASKWFDLILCGHIHTPFNVGNVYNPGALETTKFNLYNEDSGVLIFTIEDETKKLVNVEKYITRRRRFVTLEVKSEQTGFGDLYTKLWQKKHLVEDAVVKIIITHEQDITENTKGNIEKYIKNTLQPLHTVSIKFVDLRDGAVVNSNNNDEEISEIEKIISEMFNSGLELNLVYELVKNDLNMSQVEELYEKYAQNTVY